MNASLWIWTHASTSIVLGCLTFMATARFSTPTRRRLTGVVAAAAFLPFPATNLTGIILGHAEIFSVSTVIALLYVVRPRWLPVRTKSAPVTSANLWSRQQLAVAHGLFLSCGIVLYTSALGFTAVDVYAAGYYPEFDWAVLALSVAFAAKRCWLPAFCLIGSVIAHGFHLTDSPNLWNYLIDPWIVIASAIQLTVLSFRAIFVRDESPASSGDQGAANDRVSIPFPADEAEKTKHQRHAA